MNHEIKLEILRLLLKATQDKRLTWSKLDYDIYEARSGQVECSIQLQYPMLADETSSGPDIAQVTVNAIITTHCSGTEGMDLVLEILAEGIEDWNNHRKKIMRLLDDALTALRDLTS